MLVVDDSRAMLDIMEHLLGFFGGSVHTAATEEMAMAIADKHEFDLVISDHFLQETTGIELLAKLRRKRPLLKAILMSGAFDPSEKEIKKHKLGAFLKKPFEMHELKTAIKKNSEDIKHLKKTFCLTLTFVTAPQSAAFKSPCTVIATF